MTFREIFRYELSYRLRSPLFWVWFVLIWGGAIFMVHVSSTENNRVVNAPVHYAEMISILEFFLMFMTAWLFGDAAVRDSETRTLALFSTAPVTKFDYLAGRYAANLLLHLGLLLGFPLMIALCMTFPWLSHYNWAPFRVMAFLQPLLLLTIPNLIIRSAVVYSIASLTKNMLATYLGGLALLILYIVAINNLGFNQTFEDLLDPLAIDTMQRVTRHWTPSEQTTRLFGFPGIMVANRLVWMALSAGLLVFLYRRFSFAHPGLRLGRRTVQAPGTASEEPVRHAVATARETRRDFGGRTQWAQLRAVARHALMDIAKNRVFLLMLVGAVFFTTIIGWEVGSIVFDTSTWPVTHLMAGSLNGYFVAGMMVAIISLLTGELVWRDRDTGVGDITATAPVPDWVMVLGRLLALLAVLVLLQALFTLVGIALQTVKGYYRYELGLYVKMMFGTQLLVYLILAALALAVHVIVNQKALGHTIVVGAWAFSMLAPLFFRIRHNLVLYNRDPGLVYSDLNGFGPFLGPWLWFKAYWGAWALLLGVAAVVFWVRSSEGGLRARTRLARLRMAGAAGRAAAFAGLLIVATGGFVFWNTNVLNDYVTADEGADRRASYERQFKQFEDAATPSIVQAVLHVDIRPERPSAEIRGAWHLVNLTDRPVDTLVVSLSNEVRARRIAFPTREVGRSLTDDDLQVWLYTLRQPLAPGDSMVMEFQVEFAPRGFPNNGIPTEVVSNGAYFDRSWLPILGYQPNRELADTAQRRKRGLPPKELGLASPYDTTARVRAAITERSDPPAHMDVTIATAPDQIAVTPGRLVGEWENGGRKYYRYVTDVPVSFGAPVFSGRFAVKRDDWNGRPLTVFYHPTHDFNVDRMIDAMKVSLDTYSSAYGPYPYNELRIVEFPRYASFARAHPHTIAFGEGSAFITRIEEDDVDRTFMVVAHEAAHMWFGNAVRPAQLKGAAMVSETLAQYNAHLALEKRYGVEMSRELYRHSMERYLVMRSEYSRKEWPLVEVTGQNHVYYFKGSIAMHTLRELVGEAQVNQALGRFYTRFANQPGLHPTSLDLVAELRAVTPDSLKYLVTDLFETITLWDVRTDSVSARQLPDSTWELTLNVRGYKARADSVGAETEVPMNDLVDIAVFGAPVNDKRGPALYRQRHWIRSGDQAVTVRVTGQPALAGIDPDHTLIDRVRGGEMKSVKLP